MANEQYIKYGTQLLFADHATDFGAAPTTAANSLIIGTPTDVQIDMTSLAASGGGRQSAKSGDLGDTTRGTYFRVDACLEFAVAPSDGDFVDFYWSGSPSSTAGTGNGGGVSGSDAAYTETDGTLGELTRIGSLVCRNNVICIGYVGILVPEHRYGTLVVINNADQALAGAGSMDETHITLTPIVAFAA